MPLETLVQALPSQWRMVPVEPTAQTSLSPLPQTLWRALVVPLETLVQALPSHWRMMPVEPTAQTSLSPLSQTPLRPFVVPLETLDQALPPWSNGFRQHHLSALQTRFSAFTVAAMLAGLKVSLALDGVG